MRRTRTRRIRRRTRRPPSSAPVRTRSQKNHANVRSERELLKGHGEREERLVHAQELRGLDRRVQVDDRVLLLSDPPGGIPTDDLLQNAVEGDARLEARRDRRERRGRPALQGSTSSGDRRL